MQYGTNSGYAGGQSSGYKVVSYASSSNRSYSSVKTTWTKSTCCGAFRFGSRCSDCPGGVGY